MNKPIYHYDLIQGSDAWLKARLGIITASQFGRLITPTGKVAANTDSRLIVYEKMAERISSRIESNYQSYDMEMGHVWEEFARDLYAKERAPVQSCGFVTREFNGVQIGYSPDGLIGSDGLLEIKSPKPHNHVKAMCEGNQPAIYDMQMQVGLLVTGREWIDYISHCNGFPQRIVRVFPDLERHSLIIQAAHKLEECIEINMEIYNNNAQGMPFAEYVEAETI